MFFMGHSVTILSVRLSVSLRTQSVMHKGRRVRQNYARFLALYLHCILINHVTQTHIIGLH